MSLPAIIDTEAFQQIEKVAELYVGGITSPYVIARELGIKVNTARESIEQWHELLKEDQNSKDAAFEALTVMLQRYDRLLEEANQNLEDLKSLNFDEKVSAQINASIKVIAELDKVRVDLLQKAGLLDQGDLGDELAEREEREAQIINILRNDLCGDCKATVARKLQEITKTAEVVVVD